MNKSRNIDPRRPSHRWSRMVGGASVAVCTLTSIAAPPALPAASTPSDGDSLVHQTAAALIEQMLAGPAQPLFEGLRGDAARLDEPMALRARQAAIHPNALAHLLADAGDHPRLELNLFDDVRPVARIDRIDSAWGEGVIISGTIEDDTLGSVMLSVVDDAIVGTIRYRDRLYRIETDPDGTPVVTEANEFFTPTCATDHRHVPELAGGGDGDGERGPQRDEGIIAEAEGCATADVMVVYTPLARQRSGGTSAMSAMINLAVAETNQAYRSSGVTLTLRLVHARELTGYAEDGNFSTELNRLRLRTDGHLDDVHAWRNAYGADLVSMIVDSSTYCGLGYLMRNVSHDFEDHAFSVVSRSCATGYYSFGHELGHNMGCMHDVGNASTSGAYPYSYGYRTPNNQYRTIMAYAPGLRIPMFSTPYRTYGGYTMGVANQAENARTLNNTACTVASFRVGAARRWVSSYGYNAGSWRTDRHPRYVADVNGDGRDDMVGFGHAGVYVSLSTGSSFAAPRRWVASYGYGAGGWRVDKHPRFLADVNGDGRKDIVGCGGAGTYVSLSTGSAFTNPRLWVASYGYNAGGWRIDRHPRFLADVNGDGRDDMVGFGHAGVYVSLSTGSSFAAPQRWVASYGYGAGGWRVDRHPRFLADVNADGRMDVVGCGNAGTYVSLSTGSSFRAPQRWVSSYGYTAGGWRVDKHPRFLADVNGDGRDDMVGCGNAGTYVSLSTGSSFTAPRRWVSSYGYDAGTWRVDKHPRHLADVNGDGRDDMVGFGNAGTYVSLSTGGSFQSPQLCVSSFGYVKGGWRVDRHPRFLAEVNGDGRADVVGCANAGVYVSLLDN